MSSKSNNIGFVAIIVMVIAVVAAFVYKTKVARKGEEWQPVQAVIDNVSDFLGIGSKKNWVQRAIEENDKKGTDNVVGAFASWWRGITNKNYR